MLDAIKIQKFSIDPDDFDNGLWVSAVTDLVGNSGYSRITLKELGMSATQREIAEREAQRKATAKAEKKAKQIADEEEKMKQVNEELQAFLRHDGPFTRGMSRLASTASSSSQNGPAPDLEPLDFGPLGARNPDIMIDEAEVESPVIVCQACAIKASELEDLKKALQEVLDKNAELESDYDRMKQQEVFLTEQNATFQKVFLTVGDLESVTAKMSSLESQVSTLTQEKLALEEKFEGALLGGMSNEPLSTGISDLLDDANLGSERE